VEAKGFLLPGHLNFSMDCMGKPWIPEKFSESKPLHKHYYEGGHQMTLRKEVE